jgi:hypothetical protein
VFFFIVSAFYFGFAKEKLKRPAHKPHVNVRAMVNVIKIEL